METVNPTSLVFANHLVTKCTFTETYTIQEKNLDNQTIIAWSGQQLGEDISAPYFLKKGDDIMPNKWFRHKDSMTVVVINHKEIDHKLIVEVTDCHFCNESDNKKRYKVKGVKVSFKYWIMRPKTDITPLLYNSLVESATEGKSLSGDFLKAGFPIGENSIEKRLEEVISQATKKAVMQQQPVEESAIKAVIENAIEANRNEIFTKYGLNYKDLNVEPDIAELQDELSTLFNRTITNKLKKPLQESIDNDKTDLDLLQETNKHTLELAKAKHAEEIKTIVAKAEQEREVLKPDDQIYIEMLNKNPEGGRIWLEGMKQGPNLNGCNPMVDLRKSTQQIETAKPNQKVRPVALLS